MLARSLRRGWYVLLMAGSLAPAQPQTRGIVRENGPRVGAVRADRPHLVLETGGFMSGVSGLDFSQDGAWLAAAGDDRTVRIWELSTGRSVAVLRGHEETFSGGCTALAFSPDRRFLLVGVSDSTTEGAIRVYDTTDLGRMAELLPAHGDGGVIELAFSSDGKYLASAGANGQIVFWDWATRQQLYRTTYNQILEFVDFPIPGVPLGFFVDTAGAHHVSMLDGTESAELDDDVLRRIRATMGGADLEAGIGEYNRRAQALDMITMPEGGLLTRKRDCIDSGYFLAGGIDQNQPDANRFWVGVWSADHGAEPIRLYEGHRYNPSAFALSPDHTRVASGDMLGNIDIWDIGSGERLQQFRGGGQSVYRVAFRQEGLGLGIGTRAFGRDRWTFNSYGEPERTFDLRSRHVDDSAEGPWNLEVTERGDRRMTAQLPPQDDPSGLLVAVERNAATEMSYPTGGDLWCYSFLSPSPGGVGERAVYGGTAVLVCFDPVTGHDIGYFLGHTGGVTAVSQSPDTRFLASSSIDRTIRIWSLERFGIRGDLDAHYYGGTGLVFAVPPDGPSARAGVQAGDRVLGLGGMSLAELDARTLEHTYPFRPGQRTTVRIERAGEALELPVELSPSGESRDPLLSLFIDGDDWVLWTPQGYYDASLGGDRLIGWHLNQGRSKAAVFYLAEQFRKEFYRPDVIDRLLETGDMDRALARANEERGPRASTESLDLRRTEVLEKLAPPRVRILKPDADSVVRTPTVTLEAEIVPQNDQPITEVTFLLNGRPAGAKNVDRGDAAVGSNKPTTVSFPVTLVPGRNELSVLAANATATSQPASVVVTQELAGEPAVLPRLYVLAIGIARYRDASLNLQFPDKDAEAFAAAWKAQEGRVYAKVETRVITNEEADNEHVLEGMEWLVRSATQRDVAVLFLSSHGVRDERQNYYLATHKIDPKSLRSTALRWSEVKNLITDIPGKFLLFVDTCHSGGITGAKAIGDDPLRELVSPDTGAIVFSSSLPREVSLESPAWGHGAFTRALLDTFGSPESDVNKDGYLSLGELNVRVTDRVKELTEGRQHAAINWPSTITDFNFRTVGARP